VPSELLKEVREKGLENVKSDYLPPILTKPDEIYKKFLMKALESLYLGRGIPTALYNLAGPLIQYVLLPSKDRMILMPVKIPREEEEDNELL